MGFASNESTHTHTHSPTQNFCLLDRVSFFFMTLKKSNFRTEFEKVNSGGIGSFSVDKS